MRLDVDYANVLFLLSVITCPIKGKTMQFSDTEISTKISIRYTIHTG